MQINHNAKTQKIFKQRTLYFLFSVLVFITILFNPNKIIGDMTSMIYPESNLADNLLFTMKTIELSIIKSYCETESDLRFNYEKYNNNKKQLKDYYDYNNMLLFPFYVKNTTLIVTM